MVAVLGFGGGKGDFDCFLNLLKLMLDVFLVPDVGPVTPCSWAVIFMYLICIIFIPISNSQLNDVPKGVPGIYKLPGVVFFC